MKLIIWIVIAIVLIIIVFNVLDILSRKLNKLTPEQVADYIENFLDYKGGPWDWDDFISVAINDPYLDQIRLHCASLPDEFPPGENENYCSAEGEKIMKDYITKLRQMAEKEIIDTSSND